MTRFRDDKFKALKSDASVQLVIREKGSMKTNLIEHESYYQSGQKRGSPRPFPCAYKPVLRGTPTSETGIAAALAPVDAVEASGGWCSISHASLGERWQCDTKM